MSRGLRILRDVGRLGVQPLIHGAPAGIRTPNQQIMRRFEGQQQGETK